MIHLEYTGKCENCDCSDLKLECTEYADFVKRGKEWSVRCIHEDSCDRMEDITIERLRCGE